MKLNDPFGRLESRHQKGYESMRDTLRENGIDTPEAARETIKRFQQRALKYIGVGMAVLLPMILLLPKVMPLTAVLFFFLVAWVASSVYNGKRYIQRYIDEDLKQGTSRK
jgi:hypothetical protein